MKYYTLNVKTLPEKVWFAVTETILLCKSVQLFFLDSVLCMTFICHPKVIFGWSWTFPFARLSSPAKKIQVRKITLGSSLHLNNSIILNNEMNVMRIYLFFLGISKCFSGFLILSSSMWSSNGDGAVLS